MGCYPIKEMISRALGKCNGKHKRRPSRRNRMVYSPPPEFTFKSSVAKSVNFSNHSPVVIIPPEPGLGASSSNGTEVPKSKEAKRTGFRKYKGGTPGQTRHEPGSVHQDPVHNAPVHHDPSPVHHILVPYYAPSPLPRWEEGARREECFGGEYRSYPTPIREGIYRIATDPHHLTTIFSEENPNACTIV